MVLVETLAVVVIVLVNTAVTALMTRFFRVRLDTAWGSVLYTLLFCPIALLVVLLVLTVAFGVAGVRPNLGSRWLGYAVTVIVPFAVGVTFDYFWMPAPGEIDVPDSA